MSVKVKTREAAMVKATADWLPALTEKLPDVEDPPKKIAERAVHDVAGLFPPITDVEFEALVADIETHGLREPGWIDERGRILDGRHRARACERLRLHMPWRIYDGHNVVDFVASLNLHRRHISESQRAMVAADLATARQGERSDLVPRGTTSTRQQAAKVMKVSKRSVDRAAALKKKAPAEIVEDIRQGKTTVGKELRRLKAKPGASVVDAVDAKDPGGDFPPPPVPPSAIASVGAHWNDGPPLESTDERVRGVDEYVQRPLLAMAAVLRGRGLVPVLLPLARRGSAAARVEGLQRGGPSSHPPPRTQQDEARDADSRGPREHTRADGRHRATAGTAPPRLPVYLPRPQLRHSSL